MIYGEGDSANNDADNSGTPCPSFTPMTSPRIGSGFDGSLDDFRLYSRSLLPEEIMQIKNSESAPSELNSAAPLAIAENQPIGTVVGEFNATDPDAGATLTYSLVSGPGDGNNSLFTLETNGTLKTASTFDYESNASSYSIRVQVKDEHNGSTERSFTVSLTDDLAENKIDLSSGTLTFDTSAATWSHSSGRNGTGSIVTESWTSPTGDILSFKKAKYTFDSIKLHGNLEVEAYGQNPLSLNTVDHGDIEILVDINASGGAGTGVEARNTGSRDNFVTGGNAPGGQGILGAGSCLLYTSPSPRDGLLSRMPSSA